MTLAALSVATGLLAPTPSTAQSMDGERLFQRRCGSCHSMDADRNLAAAHLFGLFGRIAGSVEGARYSDALRASGIVWDRATLDAYLAAPLKVVPGGRKSHGVADASERMAIIAFMEGAN